MNLLTKQEIETWIAAKNTTVLSGNQIDAALHTALDALARLEDAEAAQALVVEQAAGASPDDVEVYRLIKKAGARKHGAIARIVGDHLQQIAGNIRALASPSGAEALSALRAERDDLKQKLISPDPYEDTAHPDDHAVNRFAAAMKGKLAAKRLQGRGGWQEPEVPNGYLSRLLREHVDKGDPVDVANFAMMVHQRGERIAPENEGASCKAIDEAEAERDAALARLAAAEGRVAALTDRIRWAHDTLWELNPNNYDHDEVCKVNNAAVEVILGLAPIIGETHGYSSEWWETRGVKMRLETVSENLARDMAEGRFPKRSAPKMVPDAALATVTPPADTMEGRT